MMTVNIKSKNKPRLQTYDVTLIKTTVTREYKTIRGEDEDDALFKAINKWSRPLRDDGMGGALGVDVTVELQ